MNNTKNFLENVGIKYPYGYTSLKIILLWRFAITNGEKNER